MARISHGVTVRFNGITWSEVTGVDWTFAPGFPKSRQVGAGSAWTDDAGTVTISNLGGLVTGSYGQKAALQITGGGVDLTYQAVLLGSSATAEVNGVTKYKTVFKLIS
ncbi:MAG: hypothetical protein ACR2NF_00395 [Pirellulales bacterium]